MRSCARPAGGEPRRVNRGRDHLEQRGHHRGGYVREPVGHGVCLPTRPAGEDLTDAAGQRRPGGAAERAPWRPLCVSSTTSMPAATPGPPFPCPAPGTERSVKVTACFWSDRLYGALARDHDARAVVRAGAERAAGRCHLRHGLTDGLEAPTRRDVCGSVGGVRGQQSVRCNGEVPWILHKSSRRRRTKVARTLHAGSALLRGAVSAAQPLHPPCADALPVVDAHSCRPAPTPPWSASPACGQKQPPRRRNHRSGQIPAVREASRAGCRACYTSRTEGRPPDLQATAR